jgi:hypothetical protein
VQLADDADFTANVRPAFNNDWDNSSGPGIGTDKGYFENYEGKLIDAKGQVVCYLRLYIEGAGGFCPPLTPLWDAWVKT